MGVVLTVAGNDLTTRVDYRSYQLQDSLLARGDVLSFTLPLSGTDVITFRPLTGQSVTLNIDGVDIFTGDISHVAETKIINSDTFEHEITCSDHTRRLDRHLVVREKIGPASAGSMIRDLLVEFASEFAIDLSGIEDGLSMGERQFDYVPMSNVLDQISQESLMIWYVDSNKRVVFTDNLTFAAPIATYDVDSETQLGDFTWQESSEQLKNRIFIKDANVKDSNTRTDVWIGDAQTSFFKAFSEPYDENLTVTSTKVDGTKKEWQVAIDPGDSEDDTLLGTPGVVFVCILNWGFRFPLNDLPEVGEIVEAIYNPVRPDDMVFMVEDKDSQAMVRDREGAGSDGVYEHMVSLPDVRVESEAPVEAFGRILLDRIAWPQVNGNFGTFDIAGWKAGQTFVLTSSKRDLFDQEVYWRSGQVTKEPIRVWIQSVRRTIKGGIASPQSTIVLTTIEFSSTLFARV